MFVSFANPFKSLQIRTTALSDDTWKSGSATGIDHSKIQNKIPTIHVVIQNWNGPFQNTKKQNTTNLKNTRKPFSAFDFMWMVWSAVSVVKRIPKYAVSVAKRMLKYKNTHWFAVSVAKRIPKSKRCPLIPRFSFEKNAEVHAKIHDPPEVRWIITKVLKQRLNLYS